MYGMTRATTTLLAAGIAGFLIWIATRISDHTTGGYWAVYGLIAGAGLVMALSQLLGGWTKWGVPRISAAVLLVAFVPVLIAAGWVVVAHQPHPNWFRNHVLAWSGDIHIGGVVKDLTNFVVVLAFGIGVVFGYSFDTERRPARRAVADRDRDRAAPVDGRAADEPLSAEREAGTTVAPAEPRFGLGRRRRAVVTPSGDPVDETADDPDSPTSRT